VQGLAFWLLLGNAKSDWPRAAIERARRKRLRSFCRPFDALRASGGVQSAALRSTRPLTLTLSREGRGDKTEARRDSRMGAGLR
jgi:hypothetical protein